MACKMHQPHLFIQMLYQRFLNLLQVFAFNNRNWGFPDNTLQKRIHFAGFAKAMKKC